MRSSTPIVFVIDVSAACCFEAVYTQRQDATATHWISRVDQHRSVNTELRSTMEFATRMVRQHLETISFQDFEGVVLLTDVALNTAHLVRSEILHEFPTIRTAMATIMRGDEERDPEGNSHAGLVMRLLDSDALNPQNAH